MTSVHLWWIIFLKMVTGQVICLTYINEYVVSIERDKYILTTL